MSKSKEDNDESLYIPSTDTIIIEKKSSNSDTKLVLKILKDLKFIYSSIRLSYEKNKNGEYKKCFFYEKGWNEQKVSKYDKTLNGLYILTGKKSNCFVIDIDDITKSEANTIKEMCDKSSNLVTKTKKGYHYYFKYDSELNYTTTYKQFGFDLRSDGGNILAPPTYYLDEKKQKITYQFTKISNELNTISDDLKKYILNLITKPLKDKKIQQSYTKEINKCKEIPKIKLNDGLIKKILDGLNVERADNYTDWIYCGWSLINSGFGIEYWDYFSRKSPKYRENDNYEIYEKEFKKENNTKNQLTISTLWYWLKQDNEALFYSLQKEYSLEKYKDISIDFKLEDEETFDICKMKDLYIKDIEYFGINLYKQNIHETISFKYFNKFHFNVITLKGYFMQDFSNKRIDYITIGKKQNLIENYYALIYSINNKDYLFIDIYFTSVYRRTYLTMEFDPQNKINSKTAFNLFTGFKFDRDYKELPKEKSIKIFLDHIDYLCNYEKESYEYFLNWCAHIIQKPWMKTNVAVVLYSDTHGIGKNICLSLLQKILDGYYTEFDKTDFTSQFNDKFKNKLIMIGNEIDARAKENADYLKNIITRTELTVNEKFLSSYKLKDYCNFLFTTNHEIVFKIDKSDRRYMLINCSEFKKKHDYYTKFIDALEDEDLLKEFFFFLKNRDITNYIPSKIPITEYKKTNMMMNLPAYIKMVLEGYAEFAGNSYDIDELYNKFIEFAKNNRMPYTISDKLFSINFKKVFDIYYKKIGNRRFYKFPNDLTKEKIKELIEKKYIYD
jgi:hypothetical protein